MTPISNFLPYVLPYVPGCTDMLAEQKIVDTLIDFCSHTLIVQRDLDAIGAAPGTLDYDFDPLPGERIVMVLRAFCGNSELQITTADMLRGSPAHFGYGASVPAGIPTRLFQKNETSFTLDRAPNEPMLIVMQAATKPARNAQSVADILFQDYAEAIGYGATSRLLLIPQQPFTSPQLAGVYNTQYTDTRNLAKVRAATSLGRGESRVRFNPL